MVDQPSSSLEIDLKGGESVWSFVNERRIKTEGCINHGQGFPNWSCEAFVKEAAKRAIENDHNQVCTVTA